MEDWQLDFEWLEVRHFVRDRMGRSGLPDLNALLFLIGIQELGYPREQYSKEEKQDLMHIAICRLMSYEGYYQFVGRDADGWPHWDLVRKVPKKDLKEQENYLKELVIRYFRELRQEEE